MKWSKSRLQTLELELEEVYLTLISNYYILNKTKIIMKPSSKKFEILMNDIRWFVDCWHMERYFMIFPWKVGPSHASCICLKAYKVIELIQIQRQFFGPPLVYKIFFLIKNEFSSHFLMVDLGSKFCKGDRSLSLMMSTETHSSAIFPGTQSRPGPGLGCFLQTEIKNELP